MNFFARFFVVAGFALGFVSAGFFAAASPLHAAQRSAGAQGGQGGQGGQPVSPARNANDLTYADLVDLADGAQMVVRADIRKQAVVPYTRAPGLAPRYARLYIEARTVTLISGEAPIGRDLQYLVDVPLNSEWKPPKLRGQQVILFAMTPPLPSASASGRQGDIQLTRSDGQLLWNADIEQRLRPILSELQRPDAPPAIEGIRDILSVDGNLAGESETQIFANTGANEGANISESGLASITVIRRPGLAPTWGVSWSDIVDSAARPPARNSLSWYRLACFLPKELPEGAFMMRDAARQQRAKNDYDFVIRSLGSCPRNR